jgi:polysaccharide chain length determinant protein (PEP-CTERM system associated)
MQEILDQVYQHVDAFWRRRWLAFTSAVGLALAGWAAVVSLPNSYEARAVIFVDTASVLNPLLEGVAVENDVDYHLAVMRETLLSRPNLERVARETDLDLRAKSSSDMEGIVNSLSDRIDVESTETNIFTISYSTAEKRQAYNVVQSLMTMFVQNNIGRNREDMESAQEFLDRQIADYEAKLDSAENTLALFKARYMDLLPGQRGLQDQLGGVSGELEVLQSRLQDAQTRSRLLQEELENTPESMAQQFGMLGSGPPSSVEGQIMELRGQLETLRSRYTDQHPDVQAAKRRLAGLMREMEAGPGPGAGEAEESFRIPNPAHSQLRMRLLEEQANVETLRREIESKRAELSGVERKLQQVPEVEAQLQKLNRDYEVMKSKYEALLTRRESAQISSDREQQSDRVQFRIIEPPQIPTVAAGPPRSLFMTAVLGVAVAAGVGLTILLGLFRTTYATPAHLRRDFDLPVIGVVTRLTDRRESLRKLMGHIGLAVAVAGFLGLFGVLQKVESEVGLGTLAEQPLTPYALKTVLSETWAGDGTESGE